MELFWTIVLLLVGLILIIKGGDFFVDAASWTAEVSGIPKLIVGATVVSVATTLPELLASSFAVAKGAEGVDMAIGNAVGSVTVNTAFIMALSILFMPAIIKRSQYMLKSIFMLGAAAILVIFSLNGELTLIPALLLLALFLVAEYENFHNAKKQMKLAPTEEKRVVKSKKEIIINIIKFVGGAVALVFGAKLLTDNAEKLAIMAGIPQRIIGLTILAIGTSLPELVTTLTAIAKKQSALSVGNIIGANIIDLTLILPISAFIAGGTLPVAASSSYIDLPFCLLVGIIATVPCLIAKRFMRWQGVLMIALYITYIVLSCVGVFNFA